MTNTQPVEAEATKTMDRFHDALNGKGTITSCLDEIQKERESYGMGSDKEQIYTERVRAKLCKEGILPEVSLMYAKENIGYMACNPSADAKDLRVTDESMKQFRVAEYKHMSNVEKAMNHYLMNKSDELKNEGLICGGWMGSGKSFSASDLDAVLDKEKTSRSDNVNNKNEASTIITQLAANHGKLLKQLTDSDAKGITKEWMDWEEELRGANNKRMTGPEHRAFLQLGQVFDQIDRGDGVISIEDLKYWGENNGVDTSSLKRSGF